MAAPFHRIDSLADLPSGLHGGVVAIGNFDGVHRGHQAVLGRALDIARTNGAPALVLTFEPHPRAVFSPDKPVFRITPPPMKARLLEALGFSGVVEHRFTREFSQKTASQFIDEVLVGGMSVSHVVTGFDFHFGKGREGGPAFLMESGSKLGFGVTLVDAYRDENGHVISSSRVREALSEGDVAGAAGLLGYRYTVEAVVEAGKKLGRSLGYPTANMRLPADAALRPGIYAVRFRRASGRLYDGVASFGHRPTIDEAGEALLETFLFDFEGELYGERCAVSFFGHLREEVKFDGLAALIEQMRRDEIEARALLSGIRPLSELDQAIAFDGR